MFSLCYQLLVKVNCRSHIAPLLLQPLRRTINQTRDNSGASVHFTACQLNHVIQLSQAHTVSLDADQCHKQLKHSSIYGHGIEPHCPIKPPRVTTTSSIAYTALVNNLLNLWQFTISHVVHVNQMLLFILVVKLICKQYFCFNSRFACFMEL